MQFAHILTALLLRVLERFMAVLARGVDLLGQRLGMVLMTRLHRRLALRLQRLHLRAIGVLARLHLGGILADFLLVGAQLPLILVQRMPPVMVLLQLRRHLRR